MSCAGLWQQPDFLKLWMGQSVSQLGSAISTQALPLTAVLVLGASPLQMGFLSGLGAAAVLMLGLFAGAWVDRMRRRPIMIAADLGRFVILGTIPLAAALRHLTMSHLYMVTAACATLTMLFDVSYRAYLPSLVGGENILEGNSKLALTESAAEVVGPGLAGALVQWITAPMAILFDAVSFLCSAVSVSMIGQREPEAASTPQPHLWHEIADGLSYIWSQRILRILAIRTASGALFLGFTSSLYMLLAIRELGLSPALLGAIISIGGASSLLGAFAAGPLMRRFGLGPTLIGAAIISSLTIFLPAAAHGSVRVITLMLGAGQLFDIAWPIYNINELSLRQAITPHRLLGRVNSSMHLLFQGILPVGALAGGALALVIGIRMTMLLGAAGFLLSTLWLFSSPMRHLRSLAEILQFSA